MATAPPDPSFGPEPTSPEVKRYHREKLVTGVAALIVGAAALIFMALWGGPRLDAAVRAAVGGSRWLRLIILGFLYASGFELLSLPFSFWSGFVLEHRYGLSNQTFLRWVWRQVKGYLVGGPVGLVALLGLYGLLWYAGAWWWLCAAAGWLAFTLVLGRLLPVVILPLFCKVTPLDDAPLIDRLRRLTAGTGLDIEGVYRLGLSADTRKANAALAGLGKSRRVLLGDTLLQEFTPEEIEVVFAHEVGHHVYRHLPKMIAAGVVLTLAGLGLVNLVLQAAAGSLGYRGGDGWAAWQDPSALPLFGLVLAVFGLALSPAQNAVSRFFERQCDRYALERTRRPDVYRSAFLKLARMNKADPDPHPLVVWLFDDHPPIGQRLAMADTMTHVARAAGE
ncbi:MAG TPA: M48 family metallopeptidase [Gemmataceae bacterium]|nr:M48 family metallopeptidase [Gemmataceae bacterium]